MRENVRDGVLHVESNEPTPVGHEVLGADCSRSGILGGYGLPGATLGGGPAPGFVVVFVPAPDWF